MHASLLSDKVAGATVASVYDISVDSAKSIGRLLHVEVASTFDELLSSPDVDAIVICTSSETHVDLVTRAAAAGKPIMCEKPIARDVQEVDKVLAAVDASGVPFMVGFNRRFDPSHRAVHEAVLNGRVGEVRLAHIISRDPAPPPASYIEASGGIFVDMTVHDFDMAVFLVGSPVVRVMAYGGVTVDPAIGEAGDIDTALTVLIHANGVITTIDNCRQAAYGYDQRVEVFGSLGMAQSENRPIHHGVLSTADGSHRQPLMNFFLERYALSYINELDAFVQYVRGGGESPVPGRAGRAAAVLALAAGQSLRSGGPVDVMSG
jgi:myo-inositol 2-dehydrogenase/D-chiro-inositol 1-dehydrogenase